MKLDIQAVIDKYEKGEMLDVWHYCSPHRWQQLQQEGCIRGDGRRIGCPSLRQPYLWMISQAHLRLGGFKNSYPLWMWCYPWQDLRSFRSRYTSNEQHVRLHCQISSNRILISDVGAWEFVVNDIQSSFCINDCTGLHGSASKFESTPEGQNNAKKSWELIFDIRRLYNHVGSDWLGELENAELQAIIPELKLSDVKKATFFYGRECKE